MRVQAVNPSISGIIASHQDQIRHLSLAEGYCLGAMSCVLDPIAIPFEHLT